MSKVIEKEQKVDLQEQSKNIFKYYFYLFLKGRTSRGSFTLYMILALVIGVPLVFVFLNILDFSMQKDFTYTLTYSLLFSLFAFIVTLKMIPNFMEINHKNDIFGVDINKCTDYKDKNDPQRKEV